jgi:hypothetical protein
VHDPLNVPRSRQELIEAHLSDDDVVVLITHLKGRVEKYGDVQAAKLLLEFKYGKNPEPISTEKSLEQLLMQSPLSTTGADSE